MISINLTKGQVALVDDIDADLANSKWYAHFRVNTNGYDARRSAHSAETPSKTLLMHRVVLSRMLGRELSRSDIVDHANRNALDNTRSNLRLATFAQNNYNSIGRADSRSGFKGAKSNGKYWCSSIKINGNVITLGDFNTALEAAIAYNHAAIKLIGEFARINEIDGWESIIPIRRIKTPPSGYRYVSYHKRICKWKATFYQDGGRVHIGYFDTAELANEAVQLYSKSQEMVAIELDTAELSK